MKIEFNWLAPAWAQLQQRRAALPHALLIRGRPGLGKTHLARAFGQSLLCESPTPEGDACGKCLACNWFKQGNHPDFRIIEPEALSATPIDAEAEEGTGGKKKREASSQIKIEQVRALQDFLAIGTHRAGLRVIIVRPAEAMNIATANALLKSLEEPPPSTLFILVTSRPEALLPTIRSRCQAIDVAVPDADAALAWLKQQPDIDEPAAALAFWGNAPLAALEGSEGEASLREVLPDVMAKNRDPVEMADRLQAYELPEIVSALQKWTYDALSLRFFGRERYFVGRKDALAAYAKADPVALLKLGRKLHRRQRESQHPLNPRLFIEELMIDFDALRPSN